MSYRFVNVLLLLGSFGIFAHHLTTLFPFTVDDAFISFRYAYNLVHHGKILWNIGQPPVEGYTSFFGIIVFSLGFLTHIPIILWSKLIGILSILGVGVICLRSALTANNKIFSLTLALLYVFFITDIITAIHAIAGLETALYFFLLFSTALLFSSMNNPHLPDSLFLKRVRLFSFFALLVGLTRPEANLYNFIFLTSSYLYLRENRLRYFIKTVLLLYILPGLIYFMWRISYYHMLFPLPFYVKFNNGSYFDGLPATRHFLHYYWPLLLVTAFFWKQALHTRKVVVLTYASIFLSGILFSLHAAPMMNYSFRFAWPMISLILASGWLIRDFPEKIQKVSVVFLLIAITLFIFKNLTEALHQEKTDIVYAAGMEKVHIPLGKALQTVQSKNFLATCDAGAIPFYSRWSVIDSCALNNKILAANQLSPAQQADYIFAQHPRVIILVSNSSKTLEMPVLPFEPLLYNDALKANMQLLKKYQFQSNYYLWVMGYPDDKAVISALNETPRLNTDHH